ncbi:UNVERIFIED_CONTAM: hypothetical protein FKN15_059059 [Acipenser sinensis]
MSNAALEPGSRENPLKFKLQDYETLRSACLKEKQLFEDPEFAADQGSIGKLPALKPEQNIVWLRPKEINKKAQFVVGKTDTTDICQGQLGGVIQLGERTGCAKSPVFTRDSKRRVALALALLEGTISPQQRTLLARRLPPLISYVVPEGQSFQKSYAGLFRFRPPLISYVVPEGQSFQKSYAGLFRFRPPLISYVVPEGQSFQKSYAGLFRFRLRLLRQYAFALEVHMRDCWLLAALSCLTLQPPLISYVVPEGQSFQKSYAGLFRFRYGCWEEVLVDDRLPTLNRKLLFTHSLSQNEFWSALLEKAYAKLCGCYASLKGGSISEAMEDFTGGIAETIKVSKVSALWGQINQALNRGTLLSCFIEAQSKSEVGQQTPNKLVKLWGQINQALNRGTLLSCFIEAQSNSEVGQQTPNKLVKGHAYSITGTGTVQAGSVSLLRLRNPWGFLEYSGPWSDKSPEWETVDSKEKELLDLQPRQDGEFCTVEMCSVSPDSLGDSQSEWRISTHQGSWVAGCSAGGSLSFTKSYWCNPQFRVRLEEDDDIADGKLLCSAVLELLQKHRRKGGSRHPVAQSCSYSCLRAVREGVRLPPGDYVIVASTNSPSQEGSFYLRVYAKKGNESSSGIEASAHPADLPQFDLRRGRFQLDSRTIELLWLRHRTDDLCVTFDDFVNIVAKLRKLFGVANRDISNPDLFESEAKINTKVKQQGINTERERDGEEWEVAKIITELSRTACRSTLEKDRYVDYFRPVQYSA